MLDFVVEIHRPIRLVARVGEPFEYRQRPVVSQRRNQINAQVIGYTCSMKLGKIP
jgi:hypothetical protein